MFVECLRPIVGIILSCVLMLAASANADEPPLPAGVVVRQGDASLTMDDLDAFAARVPRGDRAGYFDSAKRLDSTLKALLLNRLGANEARRMGLDKDPMVQREIALAVEEALLRVRMAKFRESLQMPDFSDLAKEKYAADKERYLQAESITVRHVLISTDTRSQDEALAIAEQVRQKALADPTQFQDLVKEYSDDPSKDNNQGLMDDAGGERYVAEFSEAARALRKVGDISPPVKTKFGYHVLVLVNRTEARQLGFDEVAPNIIAKLSDDYVRDQIGKHIGNLQASPIESNPELVASLRSRYYDKKPDATPAAKP